MPPELELEESNQIVPAKPSQLEIVVAQSGLEMQTASGFLAAFQPFITQIQEWESIAKGINVTSALQTREIKLAREGRLMFKDIRLNVEKTRKRLKDDFLKKGQFIDALAKVASGAIEPLEQHLKAQEEFVDRQIAAAKAKVKAAREEVLRAYGVDCSVYLLADMTEDAFAALATNSRNVYEAKADAARKAEADRIASDTAKRAADEELRKENERLRAENAKKDADAAKERAVAKAKQDEADRLAKVERDAEMAKERQAREIIELQARKDREARQALESIAAAEKAKADAKAKAEADAARRAAAAPDYEKLMAFCTFLQAVKMPECATKDGIRISNGYQHSLNELTRLFKNNAQPLAPTVPELE